MPEPTDKPRRDTVKAGELIEVYRARDWMEVDRARVEVLEPEGIQAFTHDRMSHSLPAPAGEPGIYAIAVPSDDAERARELLGEAIDDGVLDGEQGQVIE